MRPVRIDCAECVMQGTTTCDDCIVTHLLGHRGGAVQLDLDEERAVRVLQDQGLAPATRFVALG